MRKKKLRWYGRVEKIKNDETGKKVWMIRRKDFGKQVSQIKRE